MKPVDLFTTSSVLHWYPGCHSCIWMYLNSESWVDESVWCELEWKGKRNQKKRELHCNANVVVIFLFTLFRRLVALLLTFVFDRQSIKGCKSAHSLPCKRARLIACQILAPKASYWMCERWLELFPPKCCCCRCLVARIHVRWNSFPNYTNLTSTKKVRNQSIRHTIYNAKWRQV